jgi:4,5-dihydroxyphthalate decarboxylase
MSTLGVTVVIKGYDHIVPLALGDVTARDLDITLDRDTPGALARTLQDPSVLVGELSFAQHLGRLSRDDRSFVGIPIFPYRAFRQRCFFVRRDSGIGGLAELAGKRIGTNAWNATGNTWSRALLRDEGVAIEGISWVVGPVGGGSSVSPPGNLPPYARAERSGRPLSDLLIAGEVDALMCPWPPAGFYEPESPIVRLIPDYRRAEQEYGRRTGFYPAHHIIGIRRELFEREPWVARSLFLAFDESKSRWQAERYYLAETAPWLMAEMEESVAIWGENWQPNGVEANRTMTRTLCDELDAQGLLAKPLPEASVFSEFEQVMNGEQRSE